MPSAARRLFLAFIISSILVPLAVAGSEYWNFECSGRNYTPNSGFERNLGLLATVVPGKVSTTPFLFSNASIGFDDEATTVYTLATCRGDASSSLCKKCITNAFKDAREVCPFKKGVIVFYEHCTLRLSGNKLMVNLNDDAFLRYNGSNFRGSDFEKVLTGLVETVTSKTTSESGMHFATGVLDIDRNGSKTKLYALLQCAPLLSSEECSICIRFLINAENFRGLSGGRVSSVWCEYRWELYKFYTGNPVVHIPPVSNKGETKTFVSLRRHIFFYPIEHYFSTVHSGKDKNHQVLIWCLVGVGAALVVILAIVLLVIFLRKRSLRSNPIPSGVTYCRNEFFFFLHHLSYEMHSIKYIKLKHRTKTAQSPNAGHGKFIELAKSGDDVGTVCKV